MKIEGTWGKRAAVKDAALMREEELMAIWKRLTVDRKPAYVNFECVRSMRPHANGGTFLCFGPEKVGDVVQTICVDDAPNEIMLAPVCRFEDVIKYVRREFV